MFEQAFRRIARLGYKPDYREGKINSEYKNELCARECEYCANREPAFNTYSHWKRYTVTNYLIMLSCTKN